MGVSFALHRLADGIDNAFEDFFEFAPPKGIGLVLDAAVVRGGGYLFIDSERGEYAGALELKFLNWSIKAIGVLATRRPDGSEGWSLLLFVFGQFNLHIAFGIFWTGLGGMIGLHHRSDVDALAAGMRTGALDDVLFPANPVADAPRIINRYRTLFPVEDGNLILGPMLELSFSAPPIVYVRIGLLFDVRNALGGGPAALSKVVLVGQVLVQLPPRDTGVPAILKLLIDVVGFYDGDTQFLLIRARLRDSFVGIEGFAKLDLAGELLVAVQFGAKPSFVLSAGGFHPKYQGLPERVPRDLDKLRVSFKLGPVSLSVEHYFAVTPNSVQAGQKTSVKADFGVAKIEASLAWDALLYLTPRFFFIVDLEFKAKVKAFGETLASVGVTATLEGPDEWHFFGSFSFSILWWDKKVPFDERWGEVRTAEVGQANLGQALQAELSNPDNVTIEAPVGSSPVTLAPTGGAKVAHPLGRLAIRQRAVPFGLAVERLGTRPLAGGPQGVSVQAVTLNDAAMPSFDQTTEQFSRGQFVDLSDDQKLTGPSFESFPSGVIVGSAGYVAPDGFAQDVTAGFETVRLDPEPNGLIEKWATVPLAFVPGLPRGCAPRRRHSAPRPDRTGPRQPPSGCRRCWPQRWRSTSRRSRWWVPTTSPRPRRSWARLRSHRRSPPRSQRPVGTGSSSGSRSTDEPGGGLPVPALHPPGAGRRAARQCGRRRGAAPVPGRDQARREPHRRARHALDVDAGGRPGRRRRARPPGHRAHQSPPRRHQRRAELPGRGRLRRPRPPLGPHARRRQPAGPAPALAGAGRRGGPGRGLDLGTGRRPAPPAPHRERREGRARRPHGHRGHGPTPSCSPRRARARSRRARCRATPTVTSPACSAPAACGQAPAGSPASCPPSTQV